MAFESKAAFLVKVHAVGLWDVADRFVELGWDTFATFAFSTNWTPGSTDAEVFNKEVIEPLVGERKILVPRVRRLFFMAYQAAAQDTESFLTPPRSGESVQMVPADREGRRTALARRLGHLPLVGRNDLLWRLSFSVPRC